MVELVRHGRLKTGCLKGRVGSSPTPGTSEIARCADLNDEALQDPLERFGTTQYSSVGGSGHGGGLHRGRRERAEQRVCHVCVAADVEFGARSLRTESLDPRTLGT